MKQKATSQAQKRSAVYLSSDATKWRQRRSSETLSILDLSRHGGLRRTRPPPVITPSPTHAGDGHSTLGLVRADCSLAGSTLKPVRLRVNQICAVMGTFTNNSVISLETEICSHRIFEWFTGNCEDDRLRFDNSAALSSRRHSVTGEGKPFVRQTAHIRL